PQVVDTRGSSAVDGSQSQGPASPASSEVSPTSPRPREDPSAQQLSLTEKVEQLRREHRTLSRDPSTAGPASNPPRGEAPRSSPGKSRLTPSPPPARASTRWAHAGGGARGQAGVGKAGAKDPRLFPSEDAPAEGTPKPDKKFSERLVLGALKAGRKAAPSAIP